MSLSVIIIAKNAEATIRRCLESVAWADQIVVVEHGSAAFRFGTRAQPILHESVTELDQMLVKMNSYSSASAAMLHASGR
ncbi:MAG: hypothetical protein ACREUB_07150 [Burkholderiales bacterium]